MTKGPRSKFPRIPLTVAGLLALTLAVCGVASRYVPITDHIALWTAAMSPYHATTASLRTVTIVGSDHRGLLATIKVPQSSALR